MIASLKRQKLQIALVLTVFLLFFFNVTGLLELRFDFGTDFHLRARLLDQLLQQGSLPALIRNPELALFVAIGLALSLFLPLLSPIKASILTFFCIVPPMYLAYATPGRVPLVPMEYTLLTILILYGVNVLASYFSETHSKQRLIETFGHYIPPELVAQISRHPERFSLEGEAREMTVLFSDIKEFSRISEQLDPRQLALMLNSYFTAMTRVLHRHGATIDKYMGDAIMVFWGAPLAQPDHPRRAVCAALEMQRELQALARHFADRDWPGIEMGIGINTGVMNVGNMGSEFRVAYTVVGDAVNLASRLEHLTRIYNVPVIVSETTRAAVPEMLFRELDLVKVRGKDLTTRIFEPLGPRDQAGPELLTEMERHHRALHLYYDQRWAEALAGFTELHAKAANKAYYELFLSRIQHFEDAPPPEQWSGEYHYRNP